MTAANDHSELPPDAFAGAFIAHRPELLRFLTSRLRCFAAAEDAVQEVYVRASAARTQIRNPRAFLFETAANMVRNIARSNGRRASFASYADLLAPDHEAITPEQALLDSHALCRAAAVLQALPPQCQTVFYLHRFEGLTQREVAQRLGISATSVEKHMRKAMARLVAALEA